MTVSSSARIPLAIFSSLSTVGVLREELNMTDVAKVVTNDVIQCEVMVMGNGWLIMPNNVILMVGDGGGCGSGG